MIGKGNDCLAPTYVKIPGYNERLRVRCGHCISCKLQRSLEWSVRLELESQYWSNLSFVTLTYADEYLPVQYWSSKIWDEENQEEMVPYSTLFKRDLQLFFKRLRKSAELESRWFPKSGKSASLRYFAVGEYGTRGTKRPHYHLILFGYGQEKAEQELIASCWGKGFTDVRPFFPETCVYVAGYVQKKLYGGQDELSFRNPEFLLCSKFLGLEWLLDHKYMFDDDHCYIPLSDKKGHTYKHPLNRYFRKVLIKLGVLSEQSQIGMALRQLLDYRKLLEVLKTRQIAPEAFFRHRYKIMTEKENKHNRKRDYTGDNFITEVN